MKEQEILIEFAKKHIEISTEDEEKIKKYFKVRNVEKNEILLNAGEVCNHLYFVVQGILRTFHLNANGTEFTRLIRKENQFCTVLLSFLEKKSSVATIQALEKGVLLAISSEDFRTLTKESEIAQKMYTKTLEDFENFHLKRLEFLTSYSPKEKTEIFLKEYHELEPRLTDKVIASYLQITPETYCRCKKSLES
ncbi:MAG: Crp/Fnr family transcriptional regulator [Cloacibacterium sp.]|nr:Crp/Fnr family transcriptional regulator [Cloacibacterium sp.]